ncbi:mitochondrial inner membrane protease subunit 1-like isoform X2 [Ostrea edulis]|uniref:mitochondrial inner membrane protease subunit 1-like isoform X2 n=1 Tax=Ostrea edulis TaxID=37623 RepID=UPI0024AEEB78|nr:mitochondrial inner membrane protease subunit 1-like isoform X2 [Ostrea edulis]
MLRILFGAYCAGCGTLLFANRVAWTMDLTGDSMHPTIHSSDKALIEYISVSNHRLQKGDIVISKSPYRPSSLICKRLVGMEHDKIIKEDGKIVKVPKGHVWLEGDNKAESEDSRDYGPVPYGLLESRIFFRVRRILLPYGLLESRIFFRWWPLNRMGYLDFPGLNTN